MKAGVLPLTREERDEILGKLKDEMAFAPDYYAYHALPRYESTCAQLDAEIALLSSELGELLAAFKALHSAIYTVRMDIGTSYPALSEAWFLAGGAIAKGEALATGTPPATQTEGE